MSPTNHPNPYEHGEEKLDWFDRFTVEPVDPNEIRERLDRGKVLETVDIPEYLGRKLVVDPEAGLVLYRLVQLFGTPNVPKFEAGGNATERDVTTWQYLFRVTFDPERNDEPVEEFLVSVYDFKTDPSTGLSTWRDPGEHPPERQLRPPTGSAADCRAVELPDEEFLTGIVQLILNVIEEPVPATYKDLWV